MGNEVNEVINNICDKLGYAASEITPEMARYMIAVDTFDIIASALLCIVSTIVIFKMIKSAQGAKSEDRWADTTFQAIVGAIFSFFLLIGVAMLFVSGANLIGWISSPKASMVQYVLDAIN